MNLLLSSFLFFLPAGIANMMPVVVAKVPLLREYCYPLDFNKTFRKKRILGDHKTIRGLVSGVVGGVLVAMIQQHLVGNVYGQNPVLIGFLLSFGALFGDSVKSFFKRQLSIPSGKSWFPFDQVDYIVGGLVLSAFVTKLPISEYITILVLYFCLHLLVSFLGFLLKFKRTSI